MMVIRLAMRHPLGLLQTSILATVVLTGAAPPSVAAAPARPDTWQFEMVQTWRGDRPGAKAHRRKARLWVKGKKMRREEGKTVTLVANGWKYDLQTDKKQGIKQAAPPQSWKAFNIPSPAQFGRMARQRGKQVGTELVGGRRMTIYQTDPHMRVWVDPEGLAFRSSGRSPEGGTFTVEMRNLKRGHSLPDSLFQPPSDYKVNQVMMPPLDILKSRPR
jgi:outer membrane lipoprotein-sorting protein